MSGKRWRQAGQDLVGYWPWAAGAVFAAGAIHILTIFAMPHLARKDAWARLSEISGENQMYVLPAAEAGEPDPPLPLMSPDLGYAFCRFNLRESNVVVRAEFSEPAWNVSVYTRHGENFYLITGADARRKELRLLITPRDRLSEEASTEETEEGEEQIIIISPSQEGVVMVRAPIRGASYRERTFAALRKVTCDPAPTPEAELLAEAKEEKAGAAAAGARPSGGDQESGRRARR